MSNTERPTQDIADIEVYLDPGSDFYEEHFNLSRPGMTDHAPADAFARVTAYIDGLEAVVADLTEANEQQSELIDDLHDDIEAQDATVTGLHAEIGRLKAEAANARDVVQTPAVEPAHEAALAKIADLERQLTHMTMELSGAQTRLIAIGLLLR